MTRTIVHANSAPTAIGPYSHATVVRGDLLFASGQTPIDPATGQLVPGEIDAQTRQVFANVAAVLDAAGLTLDNVVKANVYLTDMAHFAAMNLAYEDAFCPPYPARTTVAVAGPPLGALVEIEVFASLD